MHVTDHDGVAHGEVRGTGTCGVRGDLSLHEPELVPSPAIEAEASEAVGRGGVERHCERDNLIIVYPAVIRLPPGA